MNRLFAIVCLVLLTQFTWSQKPSHRIFSGEGDSVVYQQLLEQLSGNDLVFFGELHNNPICHWLQIELTADLFRQFGQDLVLGAEMFEADDQLILDEYLKGYIQEKNFREEAKLWTNYSTDYRPLVEFAREHDLSFIATNIPRRYASMVAGGGFVALDTLSDRARQYIAPLPIEYDSELPGYKKMLKMGHMHGSKKRAKNLPRAQAIKDATMAHFILKHLNRKGIFLHYNGTYHSNDHEGIVWYIKQHAPELKVVTIATVEQENPGKLKKENQGLADFVLVVDSDMTRTY